MNDVSFENRDGNLIIGLSGRVDSGNAELVEQEITAHLAGSGETAGGGETSSGAAGSTATDGKTGSTVAGSTMAGGLVIDAEGLEYISSAGLRVLLRLQKKTGGLEIINAGTEVYEILDMTGFTQMMAVSKAYRRVSVEGCEVIGEGANGKVYRIDQDNVVKTYKNADALAEIQHEREVARTALILGIPTAISYDVVKVGDSYGSVFELLDAKSFAKILAEEPDRFDWCVTEYVNMLRKIHETVVPAGKLPPKKALFEARLGRLAGKIPDEAYAKLQRMLEEIPASDHMIHGDYHTKNIVLAGDEVLLIDMDTLGVGHPIFELVGMYNAFRGFYEGDPDGVKDFQGFDAQTASRFWTESLHRYLGGQDETDMQEANEAYLQEVENKVRVLSYMTLVEWGTRHHDPADPKDQATMKVWREGLLTLLPQVDSLTFDSEETQRTQAPTDEIRTAAKKENLPEVTAFADAFLEKCGCKMAVQMQIDVALEEIFVNIASYAYPDGNGAVTLALRHEEEPEAVWLTFIDSGIPYNPLAKEDPDITLPAEERQIGGLGIYMVRKSMDEVIYEYRDGQNILHLKKLLARGGRG